MATAHRHGIACVNMSAWCFCLDVFLWGGDVCLSSHLSGVSAHLSGVPGRSGAVHTAMRAGSRGGRS